MSGTTDFHAPSRGNYLNSGNGAPLVPIDIGHTDYLAMLNPETAFWALVHKERLADVIADGELAAAYRDQAAAMAEEMRMLRFGLKPSAVYVNPTELCNLDCTYCYIPGEMRKHGQQMSSERLIEALARLKEHFAGTLDDGRQPQIIFHGAEPLMNKKALFAAIDAFDGDFRFGVQTNGTKLDSKAIDFLTARGVSIGLSLDGPLAAITDRTRLTWTGKSVHNQVLAAMEALRGYPHYSVIATATTENLVNLTRMVELFHDYEVPTCMLNQVRCTLAGARQVRPDDAALARHFLAALERSHQLCQATGRKLVVANFANILLSILAPTARRLMCDISPCGGGRAFFALAPGGDLFPCSEFIGLEAFNGGNLFRDPIQTVLESEAFRKVTERNVDHFQPCRDCAIRHFCGSPCPAEAWEMNGGQDRTGAFCEFYEEQVRYAFRLIADGQADDFLWDGWDRGTETTIDLCL
ncbi:peptide-modifying radical SAM enzyme CbpB [Sedimenticola hydrogenitrophicus]|uniref:peptide-modifying radical SAM enzyme CbpB n=1 Tax=Sedimenticola hydrogenitrophicus TaxID=2967975 RepID=UPI0023AE8F74|nr:peptide-modifying radical SAM enzyme CbpB [Sedimenticola hydrogenitrophicus]